MAFWSGDHRAFYNQPEDFVFASERLKGRKPLDLAAVLKRKSSPRSKGLALPAWAGIHSEHTVGSMLAEMGEHQLTIRDYLRHSNLHVTNSTCRRHRRPSVWHTTSWSTPSCLPACYPNRT